MKQLILWALALAAGGAAAQVCAPTSKEMAQYAEQRNWTAYVSKAPEATSAAVTGFVDPQRRFYFGDLTRSGKVSAQLTVDPKNRSYQDFFKYCAIADTKGSYLRSMRRSKEGNRYLVSLRYLASMAEFANHPWEDQGLKEGDIEPKLTLEPTSILVTQEWSTRAVVNEINDMLKKQMRQAREPGLISLDFTGWDDLVCDLVQGNATLSFKRAATAKAALVKQTRVIDPADLTTTYQALRKEIMPNFPKERAWFAAGRAMEKLEAERRIAAPADDKASYETFKSLMNPALDQLADLDAAALGCLADQRQVYERETVTHFFNVQFAFPSLAELTAQSPGSTP